MSAACRFIQLLWVVDILRKRFEFNLIKEMNSYLRRQLSLLSSRYLATRSLTADKATVVRTPQNLLRNGSGLVKFKPFFRNSSNVIPKKFKDILPKTAISSTRDIHDSTLSMPKKRIFRKRRSEHHEKLTESGYYNVTAFATAEEYDLEKLLIALKTQDLYEPKKFFNSDDSSVNEPDVLYAVAKYQVGKEPRDIYFFREGTVVMWNFSDMESSNILLFLKNYEQVGVISSTRREAYVITLFNFRTVTMKT